MSRYVLHFAILDLQVIGELPKVAMTSAPLKSTSRAPTNAQQAPILTSQLTNRKSAAVTSQLVPVTNGTSSASQYANSRPAATAVLLQVRTLQVNSRPAATAVLLQVRTLQVNSKPAATAVLLQVRTLQIKIVMNNGNELGRICVPIVPVADVVNTLNYE